MTPITPIPPIPPIAPIAPIAPITPIAPMTLITHGALPAVQIATPDGASAIVTLYGAHLVSWQAAGREQLFCSARSSMDGTRAIRGGVPLIFPQFAERGAGTRHGFARTSTWRLADSGASIEAAWAEFVLCAQDLAPEAAAAWPHAFELTFRVELIGAHLALALAVKNTGHTPFAFAAALHGYLATERLARMQIEGVGAEPLRFDDAFEAACLATSGPFVLAQDAGQLLLEQRGFDDVVLWNPGATAAAALSDMGDDEYQRFVCIEPAQLAPVTLAPGQAWLGQHWLKFTPA